MDNIWTFLVSSGILVAVLGLGVTGIKYLKMWLDVKIAALTDQIHSEKVRAAVKKVTNAITLAVVETSQIEADAFKAAALDGKLTEEEKIQLRDLAKERAMKLLNEDIIALAVEDIGDFDSFINTHIENAVVESKK